jgi:hypothetical protein
MEAECLVETRHGLGGDGAKPGAKTLDRNRSNLLCLGLGVLAKASIGSSKEHLEGVDPGNV